MSDTLTVSNINYRTISGSTITASTIMGSTLSISTLIGSTITASTMTVSRITASTITVSTIFSATGQTAIGNNVTYPNRFVEVGSDVANSMYLDFHSSDAALPDYSTRIQSLGGATTGTGNLNMYASTIGFMPTVGVGIGTTVPQTGVHVRTFTGYSAPGQAAIFESALGAINKEQRLTILINNNDATGGSAAGSYSAIQSAMNNVANTPLILQPNGSNVGIGITNPGYPLDVVGITRSAGIINTVPGYYIGYTTNKPIVYQSTGTNNANGTLYANSYNYVMYPSNTQSPAGFVTTTGGKYSVSYSGIYAISFTLGPSGTQTAALEPFIAKNQYSDDLNTPGTGTLASSTILSGIGQLNLCWTGYLSSGDFITTGCYMGTGSCTLNTRTTLSITLVHRTA